MTDSLAVLGSIATLVTLVVGGGVGWYVALRKDRREKVGDERAATTDGVNTVIALSDHVAKLQGQVVTLFQDGQEARELAATATTEVARIRSVIASLVRPILEWIDGGARPPAPPTDELRAFVEHDDRSPDPT